MDFPLYKMIEPEVFKGSWEYFWYMFPYGVPGLATLVVGLFMSYFGALKALSKDTEDKPFFWNLTIAFVSFGIFGLLLTFRAWIQDLELLVFLNNCIYVLIVPVAPTAFYLSYVITGRKNKILYYYTYFCWALAGLAVFGISIGQGFQTEAFYFPFGIFPKGSIYIKPFGTLASLGYFFIIVPSFIKNYQYMKDNYHPSLFHGVNLLFLLLASNGLTVAGYNVYPGGSFLFIPLLMVAYGVFQSDFLNVNELLFNKNGMFYSLFGLLSFLLIMISFMVSFGITPDMYIDAHWFPWGIPPAFSLFFSIFLAIVVAGANPSSRLNQLCAFALMLTGFYVLQSIPLKMNLPYIIQLRLSQFSFLFFSLLPAIMVRLSFEAIGKEEPKLLKFIDASSVFCAVMSITPYLYDGYYDFPWGRTHRANAVDALLWITGGSGLTLILIAFFKYKNEVNKASKLILSAFLLNSFLLLVAILPAFGIPLFPFSDFQFVPAFLLGYSVLRHETLVDKGRTIELSKKLANLGLLTMFLVALIYFPGIRQRFGFGESAFHLFMIITPLVLFNYLMIYILSRPLAEELDVSYFLLDLEKQISEKEREKAIVLQDKAEESRAESEKLLLNILPAKVAEELKHHGEVTPVRYDQVSVLFTDFKGFTKAAENMEESQLLKELDSCFTQFDEIIRRNNLEKLKTIGDSYMCAGGLPDANRTNAIDACLSALEIQAFMKQLKEIKMGIGDAFWELRLGIHTGPVVAGVVGRFKFAYDIWGDTVNTASRMESSGEVGEINISQTTHDLVQYFFETKYRGKIHGKNKGELDMYFLKRLRPRYSEDEDGRIPNNYFRTIYFKIQEGAKIRWKKENR